MADIVIWADKVAYIVKLDFCKSHIRCLFFNECGWLLIYDLLHYHNFSFDFIILFSNAMNSNSSQVPFDFVRACLCRVTTLAGKAGKAWKAGKMVFFKKSAGKAGNVYIFHHSSWESWIISKHGGQFECIFSHWRLVNCKMFLNGQLECIFNHFR